MREVEYSLETDEIGLWLIVTDEWGVKHQAGHVSWAEITRGVQGKLLQDKFFAELDKLDREF